MAQEAELESEVARDLLHQALHPSEPTRRAVVSLDGPSARGGLAEVQGHWRYPQMPLARAPPHPWVQDLGSEADR